MQISNGPLLTLSVLGCSAEILTDLGIPWVILGHSERRALIGESSEVLRIPTILLTINKYDDEVLMVCVLCLRHTRSMPSFTSPAPIIDLHSQGTAIHLVERERGTLSHAHVRAHARS